MVVLKFLLPLFFLIFSFTEILKLRVYASVSVGVLDLVLALIALIWIMKIKKNEYFLKKPFLIFVGIAIFSLIINFTKFSSQEILVSFLYFARWVLYASLYFIMVDIGKQLVSKISIYMFFSGFLILIFGFFQIVFYPSLKNLYYLGYDEHMHRLFATFLDPNFAGTFLVLLFVFIFLLRDKLFGNKKFLSYLVLGFNFIAIVLTYSRGAILMLIVCVVIYSALTRKWKLTAGIICLFAVIFFVLSPIFSVENTNLLRFASVEARIDSSKKALEIFQKNPMGVGFNTYRFAREKYERTDWSGAGPSHAGAGVDNSFILILVTTGVFGLISYIYLLYKMFMLGFLKIKQNPYALILIVSLGGLIVNSLFLNSLFYSFIMIWIWVLAGLTESNLRE